ncbi:NmrA-domain-containing protein [Cantharellus anzutake]|uniref:NmrA-domain-containing protein n=1 Tax=Cantharellus anzutake TaxID=1750568 RepID=UPI001905122A|nr:NmrA-domain-containing protein [Cantharellus anzutake]KAF8336242.1 NmrA-domain-containing protein [Cantharellus anzutake]
MSNDKKIIAVLGSTGVQGGSVVRSLLADGTFAVRGLTRNVNGEAATKLKEAGAQVVFADLEDVESLKKAFKGVYGVFGVTVWALYLGVDKFDQDKSRDHETQHGKNIVDAVESEGIKHLVWSTLEPTESSDLHVYHFESKANVDKYIAARKVPATLLFTSVFFSNLTRIPGWLKKEGDTVKVEIPIPHDVPIPWYDARGTGDWVVPILKNPDKWIGKRVDAYGSSNTPEQVAEVLKKKTTGKNIVLTKFTDEQFHSAEFRKTPIGAELWLNMKFVAVGGLIRDPELSKQVNPNAFDLEQFVEKDEALKAFLSS